jgi:branched-chain amino acid transport system permease protein
MVIHGPNEQDVVYILLAVIIAYAMALPLRLGLFSIAPAALAGVAGYTYAFFSTTGHQPIGIALLAGVAAAFLLGAALAVPLGRIRGIYTGIATLSMVAIATGIESGSSWTGGPMGYSRIPTDSVTGWVVLVSILTVAGAIWLDRSTWGRKYDLVGSNPAVAASVGIDVGRMRRIGLVLSAVLAGIFGVLFTRNIGYISPDDFNFFFAINIAAYAIVGGVRHWAGPAIGATLISIPSTSMINLGLWNPYITGLAMTLVLIFLPQGLGQELRMRFRYWAGLRDPFMVRLSKFSLGFLRRKQADA